MTAAASAGLPLFGRRLGVYQRLWSPCAIWGGSFLAPGNAVLMLNALLGLGTALAPVLVAIFVGLGFWWDHPAARLGHCGLAGTGGVLGHGHGWAAAVRRDRAVAAPSGSPTTSCRSSWSEPSS